MEKATGYRYEFEFLPVAENAKAIHGRKGTETICVACYEANAIDMPPTVVRDTILETYTATSHRYVECSQCGECISER